MQDVADRTQSTRRGFTLVELLVVIGIIALLIGILLPTLSRARDASKATACLSNQRQIGTAFVMYINDHENAIPTIARDNGWKPWSSRNYGLPSPGPAINQLRAGQRWNFHRAMFPYIGGETSAVDAELPTSDSPVFVCPSAVNFPLPGQDTTEWSNTSYLVNGVMVGRRITQIPDSSKVAMLSEGRYRWYVSACRPYPVAGVITPSTDLSGIEYRQWMWYEGGISGGDVPVLSFTLHDDNEAGNMLAFDGHAERKGYKTVRPADFGLDDSLNGGGGLSTDTWADIVAQPGRTYAVRND